MQLQLPPPPTHVVSTNAAMSLYGIKYYLLHTEDCEQHNALNTYTEQSAISTFLTIALYMSVSYTYTVHLHIGTVCHSK